MSTNDLGFSYSLKRNVRAKRLTVSVYWDGRCVVTAPVWTRKRRIERLVNDKKEWVLKKIDYFKKIPVQKPDKARGSRKEYLKYKEDARMLAEGRLKHFNAMYGFEYKKVYIRNQKTRWGSCSSRGNLNFNYQIALLPAHLSDYVIVHELCHLKELNHGRNFWKLVEETVPNWKECRNELRKRHVVLA